MLRCAGVSSIVSGGVAKRLIHRLGPAGYTLLANGAFILSTLMKGFAATPLAVFASLLPCTPLPRMRHTAHAWASPATTRPPTS